MMTRFPLDFDDLLTARGRDLVAGRHPASGRLARDAFFCATDLLDPEAARTIPALLERSFGDVLVEMSAAAPDPRAGTASYRDLLPKTGRLLTATLTNPIANLDSSPAPARARHCGLLTMLESPSCRQLVEALCGHAVIGPVVTQVLCYRPGDYSGPHTDHHPEYAETRDGYTDLHLTFSTPGVAQQLLIYEEQRHLSAVADVSVAGTLTVYRLPFWHYTTPLVGTSDARRWLVMATFIHPGLP
jgi:hypothetical protein